MKRSILIILFALVLTTISCKKDEPVSDNIRGRDYLYDLMNDLYYWVDDMPIVNPKDYTDPYTLLEAMRYRPIDRWSNVQDYEDFMDYYAGNFVGHGIKIGVDDDDKARIAMIYKNAPLYESGIRRGWIIKTVNGVDIGALLAAGNYTEYNIVMQPAKAGITNNFVFTNPATGEDLEISSTKAEFEVNSVLTYTTLNLTSGLTGYLAFESFIDISTAELEAAFGFFKASDIKDLILDLRYNGGGRLDVAQKLASYIAGNTQAGKVFVKTEHNTNNSGYDESTLMLSTTYGVDLTRLIVISTRETASASENVINSLIPFMDVICIGDTTNGKPVGMYGIMDPKEMFVYLPIAFKLVNSDDEGDFFDGFAPEVLVQDDITHDFGHPDELCLAAAIDYLETGGTKGFTYRPFKRTILEPGRPAWQNNTFILRPDIGK